MKSPTILTACLTMAMAITASAQVNAVNDVLLSRDVGNAMMAGPDAQKLCESMAHTIKAPAGMMINNTFTEYFPEGSMPSLETLTKTLPNGTIPDDVKVSKVLDAIGPDVDLKSESGYGRLNGRASQNGPIGGLPAFCRFGAQIATSPLTSVYSEVWLPLASDPKIPLPPPDANFPTNTTPYEIGNDGKFSLAPLYYIKGWYKKIKPSPYAHNPLQPNDLPAPTEEKKSNSTKEKPEKESTTPATGSTSSSMTSENMKKRSTKACPASQSIPGDAVLGRSPGWNGRLAVTGNGGLLGFPVYPTMKQNMARYNFAVAGTNLGHFSSLSGVTWINGSQFTDTMTDFASRANHVTLLLAESVIEQFYGPKQGVRNPKQNNRIFRYYLGSSVGGARGLSAAQVYPEDFDGILVGAPAIQYMNMNAGELHTASIHNKTAAGKDAVFTQGALYGPIKDVVTRQCDGLDGVIDNIISAPEKCKPDLEKELLCGTDTKYGKTNGTCLTKEQIKNVYELYRPTMLDGEQVYPAYWPGLEDSASNMKSSNGKASGYYQLVVLKLPKLDPKFNPFKDMKLAELKKGIAADPGGVNAENPDLSKFVQRGGKLMMYHGSYDLVVSPQSTIDYFNAATKFTAAKMKTGIAEVAKSIKLYNIYGMRHSRGGPGATHFGAPSQNDVGSRPYKFESQYDMTLAIIAWAEKGVEPHEQIAARYNIKEAIMPNRDAGKSDDPITDLYIPTSQQNYNWGLVNTRLLCPYPLNAVYQKGKNPNGENGHQAFVCA